MSFSAESDGRGCLFTTPDERVADLRDQVTAALFARPFNFKKVESLQDELRAEVRKSLRVREVEASREAALAWNTGRTAA